jgi:hypothetical protein
MRPRELIHVPWCILELGHCRRHGFDGTALPPSDDVVYLSVDYFAFKSRAAHGMVLVSNWWYAAFMYPPPMM